PQQVKHGKQDNDTKGAWPSQLRRLLFSPRRSLVQPLDMSDSNKDNSCSSSSSSTSGGTSEVLFRWPDSGGASNVCVSGAWCGWSEIGTPLSSAEGKDGRVLFSGTVRLPRGNHKFRFVIDGEWRHDPKLPTERDEATGEVCNVVKVSLKGDLRVRLPEQ
ncbi:unnamed protein product, partial [Ectocarpus sp. 12 AP-2014]